MFAVSMLDLQESAAYTLTVRLFCVMDDATFVGPAEHVIECVQRFQELLAAENLHLNFAKCQFLSHPDNALSDTVTRYLNSNNVPLVHNATMLLGAPIGWDVNKKKQLLQQLIHDQLLILDTLQHSAITRQEAMLVVRSSTSQLLGYLTRVVEPSILSNACKVRPCNPRLCAHQTRASSTDRPASHAASPASAPRWLRLACNCTDITRRLHVCVHACIQHSL